MSNTQQIESSVIGLLSDLANCSDALLVITTAKAEPTFDDLKGGLQPIIEVLERLQRMRALHPIDLTAVIRQYAPAVGEVYETVMDVSDNLDECNHAELMKVALEIRGLLQPTKV